MCLFDKLVVGYVTNHLKLAKWPQTVFGISNPINNKSAFVQVMDRRLKRQVIILTNDDTYQHPQASTFHGILHLDILSDI